MWKSRKQKIEGEEILLDIYYDKDKANISNFNDFIKVEEMFKSIKGISTISFTTKKDYNTPDIIGLAKWNDQEIYERLDQIMTIPNVKNVKFKKLLYA